MKIFIYNKLTKSKRIALTRRPSINLESVAKKVKPIIEEIKNNGLTAVKKYAKLFNQFESTEIKVSETELTQVTKNISPEFKEAVAIAYKNIYKFHEIQKPKDYSFETMEGIKCSKKFIPIENVGLYIPGGTAVLPSTFLMLAIPALIAKCKRIVVCTPAKNVINPAISYIAKLLGINEIYKVGGVQAIGLMAYGTKDIKKVDKIFGPGNQYVTAAKAIVSTDVDGCTIDMISGPSELLVIADKTANPRFVAADLLSQAEHGVDSQVILCTTNIDFAREVQTEIKKQIKLLPRETIAKKSLKKSFIIIFDSVKEAIEFSNNYAPEHLILNFQKANRFLNKITNAGSIFIGNYSPESAGDYASGTNHSLPTYGFAKSIGGVSVEMFMKGITIQKLSPKGLRNISQTVIKLAETENLQAHSNAIKIRLENEY